MDNELNGMFEIKNIYNTKLMTAQLGLLLQASVWDCLLPI